MSHEKDYSQDDLEGVPSPEDANFDHDPAPHQVPQSDVAQVVSASLPEAENEGEEVVVSPRKIKAAPKPTLPVDVARALGLAPASDGRGSDEQRDRETAPEQSPSGSAFWDDEAYCRAKVEAGGMTFHLRELSEETLFFVTSISARIAEATDDRVSAELAGHLFSGLQDAPPAIQKAAREVSSEDAVLIKTMITEMRDRALCEGIVSWTAPRPCTDENKLKLGRAFRDRCLQEIFRVSTFGADESDFLADSSAPLSQGNRSKSSQRNLH